MSKILSILFLSCLVASASDRITLTITITNTPANTDTIVINGVTRTWKTSVATPSIEIATAGSIAASTTNLWNQFAAYPWAGALTPSWVSTSEITLRGQTGGALTASTSGTWATLTLSTQSVATAAVVRVPFSVEIPLVRVNNASQLASDLATYSATPFPTNSILVDNLIQVDGNQTMAGAKTFTGGTVLSNTVSMHFDGNPSTFTTNGIVFTKNGGGSTNTHYIINGNSLGEPQIVDSGGIAPTALPDTDGGIMTYGVLQTFYPLKLGVGNTNVYKSQNRFDTITASQAVVTNAVLAHKETTVATLANGNNAGITIGDYSFVRLTAGPTGAFTINGIVPTASASREIYIYNSTGQNMTIANDSGVDPTPANRIYTMTGADITSTGNCSAHLIYNQAESRWIVFAWNP